MVSRCCQRLLTSKLSNLVSPEYIFVNYGAFHLDTTSFVLVPNHRRRKKLKFGCIWGKNGPYAQVNGCLSEGTWNSGGSIWGYLLCQFWTLGDSSCGKFLLLKRSHFQRGIRKRFKNLVSHCSYKKLVVSKWKAPYVISPFNRNQDLLRKGRQSHVT